MSHRHNSLRRWILALALLATVAGLLAVGVPAAHAGRYTVAQCDRANRDFADAELERRNGGDYGFAFRCAEDEDGNSLQIRSLTGAPRGRHGRIVWRAPDTARIVAVDVEARLRSDAGHRARLGFLDAHGGDAGRIATGPDSPGGFRDFSSQAGGRGRAGFAATLLCAARTRCARSEQARTWIRSVRLTIDDSQAPKATASGALLASGWRRGAAAVEAHAADAGSGVRRVELRVNGKVLTAQAFRCARIQGTALASRTRPCAASRSLEETVDTVQGPFVDGRNRVAICALDFGDGGKPGCVERVVRVDNAPPRVAFASHRDPDDPELIRARVSDPHSGVASGTISYRPLSGGAWRELPTTLRDGELRARVNSAAEPAGRYLFRVRALDAAGNAASGSVRADGERMVLAFPLREATRLRASIDGQRRAQVRYGSRPRLDATLRDAQGRRIAGEPVDIVQRFAGGSSLSDIERTRVTDARGRLSMRLARGPSRRVLVRYAGSRRYLPAPRRALRLTVRGSARLAGVGGRVRAGGRVRFHGRVGTYGAAVPRGKLVELQVKGGGLRRYRTVRQAFRTDPRGRWSMRYGFDRFYERPTRFRFRLKVAREGNWPYRGPTVSRSRALVVTPRG